MGDKLTAIALAGSRFRMKFSDSCDYARGVGFYQRALRRDGRVRFIIYPNMPMQEKKSRFPNLSEEYKPEHRTGVQTKYEKIFRQNMPSTPDSYCGPSYYRKNGMIWVQPYYATSRQMSKKTVFPGVDLTFREFCNQRFPKLSSDLIEFEIKSGLIAVNLQKYQEEGIIREGDVITRVAHYHEKPILDRKLNIIYEDDGIVVVDKPASWPVHMCGGFRMNSLLYFMYKTMEYSKLRTIHRLDRLTSGVLLIAKTKTAAKHFATSLNSENTQKQYLALVHGHFPQQQFLHDSPLTTYRLTRYYEVKFHKTEDSISAKTLFTFLNYDERNDRSLVLCQPLTGRTHQIRLHLTELGHPIVYDTLYGSEILEKFSTQEIFIRSSNESKIKTTTLQSTDKSLEITCDRGLLNSDKYKQASELNHSSFNNNNKLKNEDLNLDFSENNQFHEADFIHDKDYKENTDINRKSIESKFQYDPNCPFCQGKAQYDMYEPMYICLHSYRYRIADMEFTAGVPDWAKHILPDDFQLKLNIRNVK